MLLQWIDPNSLSDTTDTTDIPNNKINFNGNNYGDKTTSDASYMSNMSDKKYDPFKEESSKDIPGTVTISEKI